MHDQKMYQTVVGSLIYLSTKTRPDTPYAVSGIAHFCAKEYWTAVKRILWYLNCTSNFDLLYS